MIVFERELWAVSPLIPDGKTPTFKRADSSAGGASAPARSAGGLKLWDGGSFDFHDVLDAINPLQHLPIINAVYRSEVKDEIGAVPRLIGSMLYGGGLVGALVGAASAIVNIVVEHETGKDLGQHIYTAIFGEGASTRRTTQIAAPKTGEAAAPAAAKPAEARPVGTEKTGAAAAASTPVARPGAKPISSKADAALQAFVAGLAKNASPAAAAAAKSAVTKRALRVTAAQAAAAGGTARSGTPTKAEISTQFRRSDWYQRNQAILKAQAAAIAKQQAAAANAGKPGSNETKSGAAILHLFTTPGGGSEKPASKAREKTGAATPAADTAPAKPTAAKPASAKGPGVAGPWVVNEIANGLSKYEALVMGRKAAAGKQ